VGWWLCARVRPLPAPAAASAASVSVVVPARDEARTLPTLLDGLARQTAPPGETIVVDDHSADATTAVAAGRGARVVAADEVPDGWTGKAAAVAQGAAAATGDVVVVLDADVDPGTDLLARLAATFAERRGLVSVQPYHRVRRWWERASAFFNLVAVMGTGIASPGWPQRRPIPTAFGPVLCCERVVLVQRIADPEVRGAVLDDVALARRFAATGDEVRAFGGRGVVEFRMYDRPRALVEGWSKNIASGAGTVPPVRLVSIVAWIAACLTAGIWVFGGSVAAIVVYVAFALQVLLQLRQIGNFGIVTALVFPLLALVFVVLFTWSLVLTARGEVRWKGRRVRLREPAR
jgi:4,4'-diaponeurosporenoate glycosyltransferase